MSRRVILRILLGVILVVVVGGALAFLTVKVFDVTGQEANDQRATLTALCAFRNDLRDREQSSRDFLRKHPHGIPGIPATVIQSGIANELRTIRVLRPLPCPKQ